MRTTQSTLFSAIPSFSVWKGFRSFFSNKVLKIDLCSVQLAYTQTEHTPLTLAEMPKITCPHCVEFQSKCCGVNMDYINYRGTRVSCTSCPSQSTGNMQCSRCTKMYCLKCCNNARAEVLNADQIGCRYCVFYKE